MKKETCEVCGAKLTEENRSKSYRNRCKRCVAKATKEKRSKKSKEETSLLELHSRILALLMTECIIPLDGRVQIWKILKDEGYYIDRESGTIKKIPR